MSFYIFAVLHTHTHAHTHAHAHTHTHPGASFSLPFPGSAREHGCRVLRLAGPLCGAVESLVVNGTCNAAGREKKRGRGGADGEAGEAQARRRGLGGGSRRERHGYVMYGLDGREARRAPCARTTGPAACWWPTARPPWHDLQGTAVGSSFDLRRQIDNIGLLDATSNDELLLRSAASCARGAAWPAVRPWWPYCSGAKAHGILGTVLLPPPPLFFLWRVGSTCRQWCLRP